jgi:hypothetical protein
VQRKLFFSLGKQRRAERRGIAADSHNLAAVLT